LNDCGIAVDHLHVIHRDAELIAHDLREGGLLTLPVRDAPVITVTMPVGSIFTVALSQPPAGSAMDGPMAQISP